jgi:hypothetical protein
MLRRVQYQRISAHSLNIFVDNVNRGRRLQFSPHDNGTVKVLRNVTILVLSSADDYARA